MALYTQDNGWERFARQKAEQQRQQAMQNLQQKQAGLNAAQNQPKKSTLEEALGGLVTGVGERLSDIWNTAKNVVKTGAGLINQIGAKDSVDNTMKDDSKRRNDIAKKYGFNSYTEAINSNKVGDDFWNEIKGSNAQTKDTLKAKTDSYRNDLSDVTKINTKEAMGQALNTYDTLLGALPLGGAYNALANAGGGVLSGIGDELKAAGREGRDFNWNQAKNNAIVGAGSGLAGAAGSALAGKAAAKAGGNALGKLLGSNVARGAAGGAAAGATGGALGAALNGGTLEDALLAAKEGAKAGGIGGGAMAGAMGLGGKALDRIRNGKSGRATTIDTSEPVEAQIVQKNRIEAPNQRQLASTVEAVEPISTRRGIAITDLDAGEQPVNVRNARQTASRGKYIDGIVRGENLPEAELPKPLTLEQRYQKGMGDANILDSVSRGQFSDEFGYQNLMENLPKELQERVKAATADGALENNPYAGFNTKYEVRKQSDLPTLDRQQYYNDVTGNLKRGGGVLSSADIPEYMQSHLRDGGGRNNDVLLNELFGDDMDLRDQYEQYRQMAQVRQPKTYTTENMAYGLNMDSNLANDITEYLANEYGPKPTKINIEKALAQTQDVPVENLATNYRKSTIPARQYNEQAIQNMPEAEITTNKAVMQAPEQRVATQERQVAANISPAEQARLERNITVLEQKQGNELLKQYGVLDKPTRRIVEDAPKVLANLQDSMGLTTPEEVQYAANHVTGGDGILAKATNQLASTATVDTRFEPNFIESLIEINGLNEADAKAVSKQIRGALNKLGERRKYVNGSDVLDTVKQLQGIARDYKGTSGTYHNATNADKFKVHVIEGVAQELEDRLWNAASPNIEQVITPELLDNMKQMYPGNTTWQNFVDGTVANARNGKELRAIQKPLVMGGYIVKGSKMSAGSFGETVANGAIQAGGAKGAAKNAAKVVADKVFNSPKQQQKRANRYQQQKQVAESQLRGETPITTNTSKLGAAKEKIANAGIVQGAKNLAGKAGNALAGATESLNNDSLAGINGIRVGKNYTPIEFDALGNQAAKFANKQMGSTTANAAQDRLESARALANAQADYDNALADYQASEAQTNALTQQMQQSQSQLGRIEQAMQLALNAGDITAYSQLADLYKQAAEIEELKNPTKTTSTKALSANQAKALTAQQQLDALSQMTPDAGTVASNIPILSGIVNLTGGNEYANQASSLATTLGYLLSGANIKESEAQRIGQAYVPTAFDSEAVRKQKLERARQLIQSYMSDTGAIEQ